ncbi:MAG: type II toxin-antitoxin system VapC family toxin [Propionibacteriaceae bacterium]|nr:type II toxin-antitoxin system VapC family toxin [Propionibacteriaceae bacterium]
MILLDTHVALWLLAAPDRIGPAARASIDADDRVCFSSVSVAETTIKTMLGRLDLPDGLGQHWSDAGLEELPLRSEHAAAIAQFPELIHHDPFDRLLLAQAAVERGVLLTSDARLLSRCPNSTLDARR